MAAVNPGVAVNTGRESAGARRVPTNTDDATGRSNAVSWGAVIAGAVGAAALSLLLLILGTGLGFSAVSPWATEGIGAGTLGFAAIAWLSFTQLAASGMGGYLAGRLRTKWTALQTDQVFFRDFTHGFLTWAVATLLTAFLLTSAVGSIVSGGVRAGAAVADGAASSIGTVDGAADSVASIASQTGSDEVNTEAETMARGAADEAREASASAAFWMFVAMLLGAIAASYMAVVGGRQRDA